MSTRATYRSRGLAWEGVIRDETGRVIAACGHVHNNRDTSSQTNGESARSCAARLHLETDPASASRMTAYRTRGGTMAGQKMPSFTTLICDAADCRTTPRQGDSSRLLRSTALKLGWTRFAGKDYCPDHAVARSLTGSCSGQVGSFGTTHAEYVDDQGNRRCIYCAAMRAPLANG